MVSQACFDAPSGLSTADLNGVKLFLPIPEGVVPGSTQLRADVGGGTKLLITVPEGVHDGDELQLTCDAQGHWRCSIASKSSALLAPPRPEAQQVSCIVPQDATPGVTTIEVGGTTEGVSLLVTVPREARPGDRLVLEEDGNSWKMRVVRGGTVDEKNCKEARSTRVDLCHLPVDLQDAYEKLVTAARGAGCFITPKLRRGVSPALGVPGLIVSERVAEGEVLFRVPASLHISPPTCREAMPELCSAVDALPGLFHHTEAGHAACLTALLSNALERIDGMASRACGHPAAELWDCYAHACLGEDFSKHPYVLAMLDIVTLHRKLSPSSVAKHAAMMVGHTLAVRDVIHRGVDPRLQGARAHSGVFLQAQLCLLSREFKTPKGSSLVPVVDLLNHSTTPGLRQRWEQEGPAMVLTATRSHEVGEELCITYGRVSNPLLLRTYGFTIPPQLEESLTCTLSADVVQRFIATLPKVNQGDAAVASVGEVCLNIELLDDSLIQVLNLCTDKQGDHEAFLRGVCADTIRFYEEDAALLPALDALQRKRFDDATSHSWWEAPEVANCQALDEVRVKMTEYLTLTAYLEALDVVRGLLEEGRGLSRAASLRKLMLEAFRILGAGGHIGRVPSK